jgi:exonuclease III
MEDNNKQGEVGDIKLYSFNARGLRNKTKREKIFQYLKENCRGIIFLQECHSSVNDEKNWNKLYNGDIYYSHGTQNARGTIIIVPETIRANIVNVVTDKLGRYIILQGTFDGKELTLVNTYLPTQDKINDQIRVLDEILPHVKDSIHNIVWGGDFNMYMDPKKDQYKTKNAHKTQTVNKMQTIIDEWNLCDIYRVLNPDTKMYTWRINNYNGIKQSRLDYWFIPKGFIYNIKQCTTYPAIHSDHNIIAITIENHNKIPRGRGSWKFNCSLLHDTEYVKKIHTLLEECQDKYKDVNDKGLKWDVIKSEIRGATISHASYKTKCNKIKEKNLIQNISRMEKIINTRPNEDIIQELQTDKKELEMIYAEKSRGVQLRAKCTHLENNESNSKYFLSKEKTNAETKNMSKLIKDTGEELTDPKSILDEQKKFYENLYKDTQDYTDELTKNANRYFLDGNIDIPGLTDNDRDNLDSNITDEEIHTAVKELATNKSPGTDGISPEFYVYFWPKIQVFVADSINYAISNNKLSIDQRRGILTLIPKKDKDIRYVKNWRPLSLLNTDYKIYAKILATRLQTVLDTIISHDQSGCMKGRSTFSNIRSTIDVINYTNEKNLPGILAFIDFEKAFDTVKWPFIYKVFEKMNFGTYFIKCIKTLYNDIMTAIANNGQLSEFFKPTRGIRQGCPISANIFVTIVEILAAAIRQKQTIIGIKIGNKTYKISQYADDTVIFLSDLDSLKEVFNILDMFKQCSGLKANREKSEAIWIGSSSNFRHKPMGIKWPDEPIKCLGVYIENNYQQMIDNNFKKCLEKIENILKTWGLRKMTLKGKIVVVNTMIISQLIYLCSVIATPQWVIGKYNKQITEFLWDKKPSKIKYSCLINSIDNGGLKLQDLETKIKSLKLKWISKLIDNEYNAPWKSYVQTKMPYMDVNKCPYYNMKYNKYPIFKDNFYNEMFKMWAEVHYTEPLNGEEVARQIIWHNTHIPVQFRKEQQQLWAQNIIFIQDLLDGQGKLATAKYLQQKYNMEINIMLLNSIKSAIPKKWKNLIKNDNNIANYYTFMECKIKINETKRKIEEITTKDLYHELIINKAQRPTSENKWQETVGLNYDDNTWASIYRSPYKITRETKLLAFHYKITHCILACGKNLYIWKIENSNICKICKNETDDLEHFLVACPRTLQFWNTILEWWKNTFKTFIRTDTYDIIFGMINENEDILIDQFNYVLLQGTYYVYKCKKAEVDTDVLTFLLECKNKLIIVQESMSEKQKQKQFEIRWQGLLEAL